MLKYFQQMFIKMTIMTLINDPEKRDFCIESDGKPCYLVLFAYIENKKI